jgi:hypothetical protein
MLSRFYRLRQKVPGVRLNRIAGWLSLVPSDELIGNIIQVISDDLRLGADPQKIVADPLSVLLPSRSPQRQACPMCDRR